MQFPPAFRFGVSRAICVGVYVATFGVWACALAITIRFAVAADVPRPSVPSVVEAERRASEPRSPEWPKVRAEHLKKHPRCEACGQDDDLQCHHIIPFSVDPTKELDPQNLITLCSDGVGHCHCHLLIGHCGNFKCSNPRVVRDARRFREMLAGKVCPQRKPGE